jgi:hypothetical protein
MALIPLNKFKTQTAVLTSNTTASIYTAPIGVTSIILMAQVSNITTQTQYVSFIHSRNKRVPPDARGKNEQPQGVLTELVKNYAIPPNDAGSMVSGKLIIEAIDSIICYSLNSGTCKITLSVLETANA